MGLSIVAVFMIAGTMSTSEIVAAQAGSGTRRHRSAGTLTCPAWYAVLLLPSFLIYFISAVGETNRAPFDLPEAESELVGGFHTEYSLAEVRAVLPRRVHQHGRPSRRCATTLFLGGWRAPWPISLGRAPTRAGGRCSGSSSRSLLLLFVFVWLRGTLPRLRYDQFMRFGWKVLIPVNLVWILLARRASASLAGRDSTRRQPASLLIVGGAGRWPSLLVALLWPSARTPEPTAHAERRRSPPADGQLPVAAAGPSGAAAARGPARVVAERQPAKAGAASGRATQLDGPTRSEGGADMSSVDPVKGFGVTFSHMFSKVVTDEVPGEHATAGPALPRPAHPQPAPGRAGEVHRLRAVRLGLPGGRDLRRGRRQHRGRALLAR